MSRSKNRAEIRGHIGSNPELRSTQSGTPVTNLSVATNRRYKSKDEMKTETEWHRITIFGRLAEQVVGVDLAGHDVGKGVGKGDLVEIEGRLKSRKWTDKQGIERVTTEIIAEKCDFLDARSTPDNEEDDYADDNMEEPAQIE